MKKTVYVASSSSKFNIPKVNEVWAGFREKGIIPQLEWSSIWSTGEDDIQAAIDADIFVLFNASHSFGAMIELGCRIGAGKRVYVVDECLLDFWADHPLIHHVSKDNLVEEVLQLETVVL